MLRRITYKGILASVAVIYVSGYLLSGKLLAELPVNWFITWLGGIFSQMDSEGFFNVWSGLNHGAHYLYFILWKPAQMLSGGNWYFSTVFAILWYAFNTAALFASAWFFYKIARHLWDETKALIAGTVYLVLFLTFNWHVVIDPIPLAALMASIYLFFKGSNIWSALLFAVGVAIKPIGIVLLPVFLKSDFATGRARTTFLAVSIASLAAMLLPFAIANFQIFMSPFHWQSGRPPWESIYAFGLWLSKTPVPNNPIFHDYSGILLQDWGWSGITPVHSIMTTPVPSLPTWYNYLFMTLLAIAMLAFLLIKPAQTKIQFLWGSLFALGIYFALFYGWSVQFLFWLAPFLILLFPIAVPVTLSILTVIEYQLFYGLYLARIAPEIASSVVGMPVSWTAALAPAGPFAYWSIILVRTIFIFVLSVFAWKALPNRLWLPIKAPAPVIMENTDHLVNAR